MKKPVLLCSLVLLAACAREAPAPAGADPAPAASPAVDADPPAADAAAPGMAPPSFDCAKAASAAEKQVCGDAELAALDRTLATRYAALPAPDPAVQRGWAKGRDECWKADDARTCVLEAYKTRLVELAMQAPDAAVPKIVKYRCSDNAKPFTMTYYHDIDPQAAVMAWGNDEAIVFPQPAASGAKYGRSGVEYWEHQGEASVDFFGDKLSCRPLA